MNVSSSRSLKFGYKLESLLNISGIKRLFCWHLTNPSLKFGKALRSFSADSGSRGSKCNAIFTEPDKRQGAGARLSREKIIFNRAERETLGSRLNQY